MVLPVLEQGAHNDSFKIPANCVKKERTFLPFTLKNHIFPNIILKTNIVFSAHTVKICIEEPQRFKTGTPKFFRFLYTRYEILTLQGNWEGVFFQEKKAISQCILSRIKFLLRITTHNYLFICLLYEFL